MNTRLSPMPRLALYFVLPCVSSMGDVMLILFGEKSENIFPLDIKPCNVSDGRIIVDY